MLFVSMVAMKYVLLAPLCNIPAFRQMCFKFALDVMLHLCN